MIARDLLRYVVSLYMWPGFVVNTAISYGVGRVRSFGVGWEAGFAPTTHGWARRNLRYGGFALRVEGDPALPAPAVVVANHQHYFDIELLAAVIPPPIAFVARSELVRIPLIGSVLRRGGHLLMERGAALSGETVLREGGSRLEAGGRVAVFPEGTRSRDGRIGPLRAGAFRLAARSGVPLVPVVLAGTREPFRRAATQLVPCRLAVAVLPARRIEEAEARSDAWRQSLRDEMQAVHDRLAAATGPRI